ncbi:hypothetical protein N0V90_004202 [Kalmusia sp. IMI 367209]|nr:hypothetical protein N0V90_004202 [Kalmusia sp. IMI 367209]
MSDRSGTPDFPDWKVSQKRAADASKEEQRDSQGRRKRAQKEVDGSEGPQIKRQNLHQAPLVKRQNLSDLIDGFRDGFNLDSVQTLNATVDFNYLCSEWSNFCKTLDKATSQTISSHGFRKLCYFKAKRVHGLAREFNAKHHLCLFRLDWSPAKRFMDLLKQWQLLYPDQIKQEKSLTEFVAHMNAMEFYNFWSYESPEPQGVALNHKLQDARDVRQLLAKENPAASQQARTAVLHRPDHPAQLPEKPQASWSNLLGAHRFFINQFTKAGEELTWSKIITAPSLQTVRLDKSYSDVETKEVDGKQVLVSVTNWSQPCYTSQVDLPMHEFIGRCVTSWEWFLLSCKDAWPELPAPITCSSLEGKTVNADFIRNLHDQFLAPACKSRADNYTLVDGLTNKKLEAMVDYLTDTKLDADFPTSEWPVSYWERPATAGWLETCDIPSAITSPSTPTSTYSDEGGSDPFEVPTPQEQEVRGQCTDGNEDSTVTVPPKQSGAECEDQVNIDDDREDDSVESESQTEDVYDNNDSGSDSESNEPGNDDHEVIIDIDESYVYPIPVCSQHKKTQCRNKSCMAERAKAFQGESTDRVAKCSERDHHVNISTSKYAEWKDSYASATEDDLLALAEWQILQIRRQMQGFTHCRQEQPRLSILGNSNLSSAAYTATKNLERNLLPAAAAYETRNKTTRELADKKLKAPDSKADQPKSKSKVQIDKLAVSEAQSQSSSLSKQSSSKGDKHQATSAKTVQQKAEEQKPMPQKHLKQRNGAPTGPWTQGRPSTERNRSRGMYGRGMGPPVAPGLQSGQLPSECLDQTFGMPMFGEVPDQTQNIMGLGRFSVPYGLFTLPSNIIDQQMMMMPGFQHAMPVALPAQQGFGQQGFGQHAFR